MPLMCVFWFFKEKKMQLEPMTLKHHCYRGWWSELNDNKKLSGKFPRKTFFRTMGSISSTVLDPKEKTMVDLGDQQWDAPCCPGLGGSLTTASGKNSSGALERYHLVIKKIKNCWHGK